MYHLVFELHMHPQIELQQKTAHGVTTYLSKVQYYYNHPAYFLPQLPNMNQHYTAHLLDHHIPWCYNLISYTCTYYMVQMMEYLTTTSMKLPAPVLQQYHVCNPLEAEHQKPSD